ncbi:LmbE family protein [Alkalihalobacillus alcalophilus ATCC 27647 = CGMCC 1.3604]|uniref:LmbE family protein n=1 Tax=Alkalihalobacillus alcalophilus ATCC 27647 = CGMCC 1.3604 TaxID=1218173 RepID=A0A094YTJ9_ALKAL|nr:PIG-L family deacetylase [Alkalihalobacillus alcalophilus]KGA96777.1 LmbE family protein [Alkalihalobacillus alcalophilus ATCC 27647 = CGMCC 1.3604]MED1564091.1 PIG-L family deacetylase [Alkalihalobacillus alcalophilus]THG88722.1 LmbE family protein [Alkalihalobacillus alcalophilus ATCC 27647 = CGMCC 1.3604]
MDKKSLVIVGAHCGDGEIQAGAIAHKYAKNGWNVTFLHLTAGEKGNPPHLSVEEYRKQKIEEAEKVAGILGGKSITLEYKDAELTFNDDIITDVATLMRQLRPDVVITHWENSIHPDHSLCQRIVEAAQLKAGLQGFDLDGLNPHYYPYYHSENWEDMEGYEPDIFVDVTEEFETYLEALSNYWFIMNSASFRYFDYYKALGTVRGCLNRTEYAQTLKTPTGRNVRKGKFIPGFEL